MVSCFRATLSLVWRLYHLSQKRAPRGTVQAMTGTVQAIVKILPSNTIIEFKFESIETLNLKALEMAIRCRSGSQMVRLCHKQQRGCRFEGFGECTV